MNICVVGNCQPRLPRLNLRARRTILPRRAIKSQRRQVNDGDEEAAECAFERVRFPLSASFILLSFPFPYLTTIHGPGTAKKYKVNMTKWSYNSSLQQHRRASRAFRSWRADEEV